MFYRIRPCYPDIDEECPEVVVEGGRIFEFEDEQVAEGGHRVEDEDRPVHNGPSGADVIKLFTAVIRVY